MFARNHKTGAAAVCLCIGVGIGGCNVDGRWARSRAFAGPEQEQASSARLTGLQEGVDIAIANAQEVDIVEALLGYRQHYHRSLEQLRDYYRSHGYLSKQQWTEFELQGLRGVKQFRYLLDAEVASDALRPVEQIQEADALYDKGLELMQRGGHDIPGVYRQDRMIEAAELFRQLIERFPNSDKIDDAAFLCGEIHKEYLPGQETIATRWYERAYTWNPDTPNPARFQAALVYDYRLHDRDRALELYRAAVQFESAHTGNARFASRRIDELTSGDHGTHEVKAQR